MSMSVREDEVALWNAVGPYVPDRVLPMDAAERLGINANRAEYLYRKWSRKGWFDCGVSARTGWKTPEGALVTLTPAGPAELLAAKPPTTPQPAPVRQQTA